LKKRFAVLNKPIEYPIKDQAKIVQATCVIHNFIRIHDPDDVPNVEERLVDDLEVDRASLVGSVSRAERDQASRKRDQIAQMMWASYQEVAQRRRK
jgi:hypothetical protein